MKIAVIAANGRSGKIFTEAALSAGHSVRAGVHRKNNLTAHKNLEVLTCDALNKADLVRLLKGQDAVVSLIGHVKGSPPDIQTNAMKVLVDAMKATGVNRIVSLTGTGVRQPNDKIGLVDRLLNLSIKVIDPARVNDGINHLEILKQSKLDWTILRVLKLQNTRAKSYSLTAHGPTKWYVSRQEVAEAALEVLDHRTFIQQSPIISRPRA